VHHTTNWQFGEEFRLHPDQFRSLRATFCVAAAKDERENKLGRDAETRLAAGSSLVVAILRSKTAFLQASTHALCCLTFN
jgi:hypothetical protein